MEKPLLILKIDCTDFNAELRVYRTQVGLKGNAKREFQEFRGPFNLAPTRGEKLFYYRAARQLILPHTAPIAETLFPSVHLRPTLMTLLGAAMRDGVAADRLVEVEKDGVRMDVLTWIAGVNKLSVIALIVKTAATAPAIEEKKPEQQT